jgi:hypothetical protein
MKGNYIFKNIMHLVSISLMLFGLVVLHTIINREVIYVFTENYPFILANNTVSFFGIILDSIFIIDLCILLLFSAFLIELFMNLKRNP